MFVKSAAFTEFAPTKHQGPAVEIDLTEIAGVKAARYGMKALLDTTAFPLEATRIPGLIVGPNEQQPSIADLLASGRTSQSAIVYMEETLATNAAAEVAEAGLKPESALAFTERTSPVRKIATVLPITDELMEDAPAMEDYVNARLTQFVQYREDAQLLNGNGTSPNIRGILNTAGSRPRRRARIRSRTRSTRRSPRSPSGPSFRRTPTSPIRTTGRRSASSGRPTASTSGGLRPRRDRTGSGACGRSSRPPSRRTPAWSGRSEAGGQVFRRSDISLAVSDSHADFFIYNKLMIRAEERLALVMFRQPRSAPSTGI